MLTIEQVSTAVPQNLRTAVSQSFVDKLNGISADPLVAEQIRENFVGYAKILREGKFKMEDYLHAVTYVSYKLMNHSNQDAYFKTFPDRHAALLAKGTSPKDISAYVAAYAKGKLVNMIMEQSIVPTWVLNQDLFQKAINVQANIMNDEEVSAKVRVEAANSLLTHLARPKDALPAVNINIKEGSGIAEMRQMIRELAQTQQSAMDSGVGINTITKQKIIDVDPDDVD